MSQAVVDELEAVEIEEEHGEAVPKAIGLSAGARQSFEEQSSVRQARQIVVRGVVCESILELLSGRDVAPYTVGPCHSAVLVEYGAPLRTNPPNFTALGDDSMFVLHCSALDKVDHGLLEGFVVFGMDKFLPAAVVDLLQVETSDPGESLRDPTYA